MDHNDELVTTALTDARIALEQVWAGWSSLPEPARTLVLQDVNSALASIQSAEAVRGSVSHNDELIRADWYRRTADIMSAEAINANRRDLVAQMQPGFRWRQGACRCEQLPADYTVGIDHHPDCPAKGTPPTEAERRDILECLDVLNAEWRRRIGFKGAQS